MPRRGEYGHEFPDPEPREDEPQRIGPRSVTVVNGRGVRVRLELDPGGFTCSALAGELADEWVELVVDRDLGWSSAHDYLATVRSFCQFVDREVSCPAAATLAHADPDLHTGVTEWIRKLPQSFAAGSREPATRAGQLRRLVRRRIDHPGRVVVGPLHGWVKGSVGLRRGQTEELDEFDRADKLAMVKAAWADLAAISQRIARGWALASAGTDPAVGGWLEPANLLWAVAHDAWPTEEISARLPRPAHWPPALWDLMPETALSKPSRKILLGSLARQLFLHNMDLHCFRILLMAATGRAPEEVTALDEEDIEFGPKSVMIDFTKRRADAEPRRSYSTDAGLAEAVLHPSRPRLDVGELVRRLLELSRPLAKQAGLEPVPLFLRASVHNGSVMNIGPFHGSLAGAAFRTWLGREGLSIQGPPDIRRMRKSGKVEKAIAFKGRISDIADDHSQETFRGHYAHGTTLRVIAGNVIAAAQQKWFTQALQGPLVLSQKAVESLAEPEAADALGLSGQDVEDLLSGQLDMGVSGCKNPRQSPFGRPGQLCPVAPLRCLECRNAMILPSNLPQLLLFAEHLEYLRTRLPPRLFDARWGQSRTNLLSVLEARTNAEIAQARHQINDGLALQLPLSAHVEFDE